MSKHLLTAASGAILILASGCHYTRLARPETSSEMQDWEAIIRESYPGYTPPPTSTRVVRSQNPAPRQPAPMAAPAPADAPAAAPEALPAEEPAAETPAEQPATETPAAPAEEPAAPAVVEIPADPAAETPAEQPAAETPAAPAEQPAAETPAAPAAEPAAQTPSGQTPPDPTNSTVYEVKAGDTLGSIAQSVYGDARYSNVIFRANTDILQDPNKLRPGMKLIVPKL